tara:strand:- start:350 stop:724 length:375 start_codon:yes stop_codon:yes gene_type:complete
MNNLTKEKTMTNINEKMDQAVINDDFDKIESIALNPKNALVRVHEFNIFTGVGRFVKKWVNVSDVFKEYWDDLNSDCQDYVMDLPQYKNMDYDKMLNDYDDVVYKWLDKTDAWHLKSMGLSYSK